MRSRVSICCEPGTCTNRNKTHLLHFPTSCTNLLTTVSSGAHLLQSHDSPPACSGACLPPQETSTSPHCSRPKDDDDASVSSRSVNWDSFRIRWGGLQPWIDLQYASIQARAVTGLHFVEGDTGDQLVSDQVVSAGAGLGEVATATAVPTAALQHLIDFVHTQGGLPWYVSSISPQMNVAREQGLGFKVIILSKHFGKFLQSQPITQSTTPNLSCARTLPPQSQSSIFSPARPNANARSDLTSQETPKSRGKLDHRHFANSRTKIKVVLGIIVHFSSLLAQTKLAFLCLLVFLPLHHEYVSAQLFWGFVWTGNSMTFSVGFKISSRTYQQGWRPWFRIQRGASSLRGLVLGWVSFPIALPHRLFNVGPCAITPNHSRAWFWS